MCPEEIVAIVSALTIRIAKETPPEELAVYSEIFQALGESISLYITQQEYLDNCCCKKDNYTNVC